MGQAANSKRNASLDDRKERAAGRTKQQSLQGREIRDAYHEDFAKGKTGGATGESTQRGRAGR